jgi:transposase
MSKAEKRKYTLEFRAEAVKLVLEQGMTLEEAADRLALPKGTLSNWVIAAKRGDGQPAAPGSRSVPELEAEVARLRKELANANIEVEILKKATAYFARESLPGTRK